MIPRSARPHEVAILEKLLMGWEPKRVASWFHYEEPSPVYKVKTKYLHIIVQCPSGTGANNGQQAA